MNQTKCTRNYAVGQMHWIPSVESYIGFSGNQGIVIKTFIVSGVVNDKRSFLQYGVATKGDVTGRLACTQSFACEQPLALAIEQANQYNGNLKDFLCETG